MLKSKELEFEAEILESRIVVAEEIERVIASYQKRIHAYCTDDLETQENDRWHNIINIYQRLLIQL